MSTLRNAAGRMANWHRLQRLSAEQRAAGLLAAGALAGLALAGWGLFEATPPRQLPAHAVAMVNGKAILRSDFSAQVEVMTGVALAQASAAQRREVLDGMVEEELFVQRGLEVGLADSDPDVRSALSNAVRLQASADQRAAALDEAALRAQFAAHPDRYGSDFEAARKRLPLDLRRAQQQAAEAQLASHLRDKATLLLRSDLAP